MQANVVAGKPTPDEVRQTELTGKLRALLARIQTLRDPLRTRENGDDEKRGEEQGKPDLDALRRGLRELEDMTGGILYEIQLAGGSRLLAEIPGGVLDEALSRLVETTAEHLGLSSRVLFAGQERPLDDEHARLLYRIAQEALGNAAHHEGARRLRFSLDYRRAEVVMTIEDDGVPTPEEQFPDDEASEETTPPFFVAAPAEGYGARQLADQTMRLLRGMVEQLGGSLTMNEGIEQGVQVRVRIPWQRRTRSESVPISVPAEKREKVEEKAKIRILLVDGQAISRAGLHRLLESYPDLEVVGEAGDGVQAVSECAELLPQLVLLDAQLPENQSLDILRQLRQLNEGIPVLLLAGREDEAQLYTALRAGAGGYLLKNIAPDELVRAVRAVARGEVLIQPQLAARLLARAGPTGASPESLTAREHEVLQLLARGLRNKEIAARLFVSERTVNFHLANIYAKLHVSGRTEALSKALEEGLLKV